MDFIAEAQESYRVEVSGWDKGENFFVERTQLVWGRDQKHEVNLRAPLRLGSIVFVRLIQNMLLNTAFPIAYQAVNLGQQSEEGLTCIELEQMHPRAADIGDAGTESSEIRVA
jgi:hypothetical protein